MGPAKRLHFERKSSCRKPCMKLSSSSSRVIGVASREATTSMMSFPWMPQESISESSMRYDVSGPHLQKGHRAEGESSTEEDGG